MSISRRNFMGHVMAGAAIAPLSAALTGPAQATPASVGKGMIQRRTIGDIEVIALLDGQMELPHELMSGYSAPEAEVAAAVAHRPFNANAMPISVSAYVIRTGGRVIAIDAGAPGAMGATLGGWTASLAAAGIGLDEIDTMLITHLHPDHVGGLSGVLDGGAAVLLPNAELVTSEADWNFAFDAGVYAATPDAFRGFFDMTRALITPYDAQKRLIAPGIEIAPGVETVALPGHTPGHMGVRVTSGSESLLIWGDVVHAVALQFAQPLWAVAFDADQALAAKTRAQALDMAASDGTLIAGMHLDFPGFGYVERHGEGYRFIAAPFDFTA
ncbi:MAG: MBL fold metallo-hydrolase [Deltaproteobacteria bacterium]